MNIVSVDTGVFFGPPQSVLSARVIDATLKLRGWSRNELWRKMADHWKAQGISGYPSAATLNRWCSGTVIEYRHNTDRLPPVAYIAPFIYKAVQVRGVRVWVDRDRTYEDNWEELLVLSELISDGGSEESGPILQ